MRRSSRQRDALRARGAAPTSRAITTRRIPTRGGASRPWGDDPANACRFANVADRTAQSQVKEIAGFEIHACSDGFAYTSPVGAFPLNAFGLSDMVGNARQHVADCYRSTYLGAP